MAELAALSRELDEQLLRLLGALETLQGRREEFNRRVEQGWFSLSKSRFAMGCKSVSALQYGAHMEPLVRVRTSEGESGQVAFQVAPRESDLAAEPAEESPAVEEIGPQDPVLRAKGPRANRGTRPPRRQPRAPSFPAGGLLAGPTHLVWDLGAPEPPAGSEQLQRGDPAGREIATLQSELEWARAQYRALLDRKRRLLAGEGEGSAGQGHWL